MIALCGELATEGTPDGNRQLAGLYLKNLITAHVIKEMRLMYLPTINF